MKTILFSLLISLGVFTTAPQGLSVGDIVPDFSLLNVDGENFSMSDHPDAKGFILVFTCNSCPVAKMYEQRIMELDVQFRDLGYPVVAINPNDPVRKPGDSYASMQERAEEKEYSFPYLHDVGGKVAISFGATRTPEIYLVHRNADEELELVYTGAIDNNSGDADAADEHYVAAAIANLEAGEEVAESFTRAIGCTIKWAQ
ncbi:MAG: thioredoxin family protein [Bacteroidota bacterium]